MKAEIQSVKRDGTAYIVRVAGSAVDLALSWAELFDHELFLCRALEQQNILYEHVGPARWQALVRRALSSLR